MCQYELREQNRDEGPFCFSKTNSPSGVFRSRDVQMLNCPSASNDNKEATLYDIGRPSSVWIRLPSSKFPKNT
jgi:hypothetical protein